MKKAAEVPTRLLRVQTAVGSAFVDMVGPESEPARFRFTAEKVQIMLPDKELRIIIRIGGRRSVSLSLIVRATWLGVPNVPPLDC